MSRRARPVLDRARPWAGAIPAGQVARQAWATRGPLALALVVVALVTFLASSAPRLLDRAATDEVRAAAGDEGSALAVTVRDGSDVRELRLGTADELSATAQLLAGNLPDEVASAVTDPVASLVGPELAAGTVGGVPVLLRFAYLAADRGDGRGARDVADPAADAVAWVSGGPPTTTIDPDDVTGGEPLPVEVGLSEQVADALGVGVGDALTVVDPDGVRIDVPVTGVFRPVDAAARVWRAAPTMVSPRTVGGPAGRVAVSALTSAASVPAARYDLPEDRLVVSYTFDVVPSRLDARSAGEAARAVRALAAAPRTLGLPASSPTVTTRLDRLLEDAQDRVEATTAQAAVVLSGVVAAALLVLVLAASLLVRRRATVLAHQRALGASLSTLAAAAAAESLALVAVGACVGLALAAVVVPGPVPWAWVVPPLVLAALIPPVLAARVGGRSTAPPPARRTGQAPGRGATLRRPLVEATVVLLAAGSLLTLRARGARSAAGSLGADLVVTAAPVLVAAAVAVLLLRLLPPVARWARRATARTRGPIALVAVARTPVAVVPVLTLVLVAAMSTVVLALQATVRSGQEAGSWATVGADAVLTAAPVPGLPEDLTAARPGAPEVLVATARVVEGTQLLGDGVDEIARLVAVDAVAEARLLAATPTPDAPGLVTLAGGDSRAVPALVVGVGPGATALTLRWEGEAIPLEVVGVAPALPLAEASSSVTVVVDRAALADALGRPVPATVAWVAGPGAATVTAQATDDVVVTTRTGVLGEVRSAPTAAAFDRMLRAAGAVLAGLGVAAVALAAAAGAVDRRRALLQLRALGLPRRSGGRLVLAELVGPVLGPAVAGVLTGVALSVLIVGALGLQSLTHQAGPPVLVLPWWVLGTLLGLILAVSVVVAVERPRPGHEQLSQMMRSG
ncbi:FtsX-like permease family protein [Cellulomonas sp.]|uniref:FtsX-like permease family protein n=1 Tax=Cellulomonas sp. TaxID=40001 RepID=UPI003BAAE164